MVHFLLVADYLTGQKVRSEQGAEVRGRVVWKNVVIFGADI
jgi:hypothetical protein